jgi:hypothetical protein
VTVAGRYLLPLAALLALATAAPAAGQSAEVTFSSELPSSLTGFHARIDYESRDAAGQPRPLKRHTFTVPAGTIFDSGATAACQASAAELEAQGLGACPVDSKVGTGTLKAVATRPPGSSAPPLDTDLTIFNASRPKDMPDAANAFIVPISAGGHVLAVNVIRVEGNVLTEEPAPVCANPAEQPPCPGGEFTVDSVDYAVGPVMSAGADGTRRLITTPPSCASSGLWAFEHLMEYRDGASTRTSETSPCDRSLAARIELRVTPAIARRCRATRFVFTAVTSGGPVAGATVRFANRRALTDGQGRAAIPARICVPGQRRATVKLDGLRKGVTSVRVVR